MQGAEGSYLLLGLWVALQGMEAGGFSSCSKSVISEQQGVHPELGSNKSSHVLDRLQPVCGTLSHIGSGPAVCGGLGWGSWDPPLCCDRDVSGVANSHSLHCEKCCAVELLVKTKSVQASVAEKQSFMEVGFKSSFASGGDFPLHHITDGLVLEGRWR